jgi:hypothetical protein
MKFYTKRQIVLQNYNEFNYVIYECGVCGKQDTIVNLIKDSKVKHKQANGHCIIGDIVKTDPFKIKEE